MDKTDPSDIRHAPLEDVAWARQLARRKSAEKRFRRAGLSAVILIAVFLLGMIGTLILMTSSAFKVYKLRLPIMATEESLGLSAAPSRADLAVANFAPVLDQSFRVITPSLGGGEEGEQRLLSAEKLLSPATFHTLADFYVKHPDRLGQTVYREIVLNDAVQTLMADHGSALWDQWDKVSRDSAAQADFLLSYGLTADQMDVLEGYSRAGLIKNRFNTGFFTNPNSRYPEIAGILGEVIGSMLTLFVALLLSVPLAVLSGIYLEIYAPRNKVTSFFELNISNLSSIPSIIYGLLGLSLFINFFGIPRSTPLVGGVVLALMIMPTIIVSTRAAIQSVPASYMEGALALGSSKTQATFHFVVPAALPGIITGIILGASRALGETAPLIMVGMVSFLSDIPSSLTSPASTLSVLIYLWGDSPEVSFLSLAAGVILVLLFFVFCMNVVSFWVRYHFSSNW